MGTPLRGSARISQRRSTWRCAAVHGALTFFTRPALRIQVGFFSLTAAFNPLAPIFGLAWSACSSASSSSWEGNTPTSSPEETTGSTMEECAWREGKRKRCSERRPTLQPSENSCRRSRFELQSSGNRTRAASATSRVLLLLLPRL